MEHYFTHYSYIISIITFKKILSELKILIEVGPSEEIRSHISPHRLTSIKLKANSDFDARSQREALNYSSPHLCESPAPARSDEVPTPWLEIELDRYIKNNHRPWRVRERNHSRYLPR